jgi:hypothetical protein
MQRSGKTKPKIRQGVTFGLLAAAISCAALIAGHQTAAAHSSGNPVHGSGSSHDPQSPNNDPYHGAGSSHNPQSPNSDPYHGVGSSHNPIVYHPAKRHFFVGRRLLSPNCQSGLCATKPGTGTHPGGP